MHNKTKSILFASKFKRRNIKKLHLKYGNIQLKQHSKNKYLRFLLDKAIFGEAMALNIVNEINNRLKFLYRKNIFLIPALRRLLCTALMQPHFDYACASWYPILTKKLKYRIETTQSKCMCFCLQLDKLKHIYYEEFECLNWLPVTYRFKQCVNTIVFKYFNEHGPNYLNEVFDVAVENNFQLRGSFQKLKCPFRKTNTGQLALSYIGPTFWNKTPDTLKRTKTLNTFKHNLEKYMNLNEL